jgi:hypothetical protein
MQDIALCKIGRQEKMAKSSSDNPDVKCDQREKAMIDHLVDKVFDPDSAEKHQQPPTTESGAPVEEQVRKEWDPKKDGGLPVF